jgi:hypothetical protein
MNGIGAPAYLLAYSRTASLSNFGQHLWRHCFVKHKPTPPPAQGYVAILNKQSTSSHPGNRLGSLNTHVNMPSQLSTNAKFYYPQRLWTQRYERSVAMQDIRRPQTPFLLRGFLARSIFYPLRNRSMLEKSSSSRATLQNVTRNTVAAGCREENHQGNVAR